jgi:hypothetical protein
MLHVIKGLAAANHAAKANNEHVDEFMIAGAMDARINDD